MDDSLWDLSFLEISLTFQDLPWAPFHEHKLQALYPKTELVTAEIKLRLNNKHSVTHRGTHHERNVTDLADRNVCKKTFQ